jgi:hypothetical protein
MEDCIVAFAKSWTTKSERSPDVASLIRATLASISDKKTSFKRLTLAQRVAGRNIKRWPQLPEGETGAQYRDDDAGHDYCFPESMPKGTKPLPDARS